MDIIRYIPKSLRNWEKKTKKSSQRRAERLIYQVATPQDTSFKWLPVRAAYTLRCHRASIIIHIARWGNSLLHPSMMWFGFEQFDCSPTSNFQLTLSLPCRTYPYNIPGQTDIFRQISLYIPAGLIPHACPKQALCWSFSLPTPELFQTHKQRRHGFMPVDTALLCVKLTSGWFWEPNLRVQFDSLG